MDNEQEIITVQGRKCISDCYHKNTNLVDPMDFVLIEKKEKNYCITMPYNNINKDTGEIIEQNIDFCENVTAKNNILPYTVDLQKKYFNAYIILIKLYSIKKFTDFLQWYEENETENYYTKSRVLNCVWLSEEIDINGLNEQFINIHIELFKEKYLDILSNKIKNKIKIVDNNIQLSNDGKEVPKKELNNYIIKKFITINNFSKLFVNYNLFENIDNKIPLAIIFNNFIKYIVDKVNKTI